MISGLIVVPKDGQTNFTLVMGDWIILILLWELEMQVRAIRTSESPSSEVTNNSYVIQNSKSLGKRFGLEADWKGCMG